MSSSLQTFLVRSTDSARKDLCEAAGALPADRRNWSPGGQARTALDQLAECAIMNRVTARLIEDGTWPDDFSDERYEADKRALVEAGWDAILQRLEESTRLAIDAIAATPDDRLQEQLTMPWGPMTLEQIISYPYGNMVYHQGQINFIGSLIQERD